MLTSSEIQESETRCGFTGFGRIRRWARLQPCCQKWDLMRPLGPEVRFSSEGWGLQSLRKNSPVQKWSPEGTAESSPGRESWVGFASTDQSRRDD